MKNRKGFTLVELMIVVAIIGLLAAIAIPNLLRARINSNDQAVRGDLRAFSTAAESYRAAQATPSYPGAVTDLTATAANSPAYLDSSWAGTVTKHGHTLTYTSASASAYRLTAASQANNSTVEYCIDQDGVLKAGTAGSAGCSGSAIAQN